MKLYGMIALAVLTLGGLYGTYSQFRAKTLAEGRAQVAEERLEPLQDSLVALEARRDSVDADALQRVATADSARDAAESRAEQVRIVYREAEVRATASGDSLAATLDSLALVVPEGLTDMVAVAERQHEAERLANREALGALMAEIAETQVQLSMADEARVALEARYAALEESFAAQGEALEMERQARLARTQQAEGPWYGGTSRLLVVGAAFVAGVLVR